MTTPKPAIALEHKPIRMPVVPIRDDGPSSPLVEGLRELPAGWLTELQADRAAEWERTVRGFETTPTVFTAWQYLNHHPAFWWFPRRDFDQPRAEWFVEESLVPDQGVERCVSWLLLNINPATGWPDDDPALNTSLAFAWDVGWQGWKQDNCTCYDDWTLHGTAPSMDEAIISVARLVHEHYGNDRTIVETDAS